MFGSDSFPLGPNNQFPRQRISSYGVEIIPPVSMQDTYLSGNNNVSRIPSIERDFNSSVNKAKWRMKQGRPIRSELKHYVIDRFRPRYAPKSGLHPGIAGEEEYYDMDDDVIYDSAETRMDEGETDDSVGRVPSRRMRMMSVMIGGRNIQPATRVRPISTSVVGSGKWLKGVQRLLMHP